MGKIKDVNETVDKHALSRDKKRRKTFSTDNRTGIRLIAKLGSKKKNASK